MKKITLLLLFPILIFAMQGNWTTITSSKDFRDFQVSGNIFFCATNGGLVTFDLETMAFEKFTKEHGLDNNDVIKVEVDQHGKIWVGSAGGKLNRFDPITETWDLITSYSGYDIHDLHAVGDSVFVGLSIGVSLFDVKKWEVKETYKIGNCSSLKIIDGQIWAATEKGVQTALLSFPNLIAPSAWTVHPWAKLTFPLTEVNDFIKIYDKIAVASDEGLVYYENNTWTDTLMTDRNVSRLTSWDDVLVAATERGVYKIFSDGSKQLLGKYLYNVQQIGIDNENQLWAAEPESGFQKYHEDDASWEPFIPDGPADNNFNALAVDQDGGVWTGSKNSGLSFFDGTKWQVFNHRNKKINTSNIEEIMVDRHNRIWVASWGGGIWLFEKVGLDSVTMINIKTDHLAGVSVDPNYVVTTDLIEDENGDIWILNHGADDHRVLATFNTDGTWQYFSTNDGLRSSDVRDIAIDDVGRKWIGTETVGLFVVDDNGTPNDKSDDDYSGSLTISDGLESNAIKDLAFDQDGVMWIGTTAGLHYWFAGQVGRDWRVISDDVNCIMVDGVNNKWIGTSGGLSMLHADGYDTTHYSIDSHPMVYNNVLSLAYNEKNGDIFIGTTYGLSIFSTPFTKPSENLDLVYGYPNPFILKDGTQFNIDNLALNSSVRIYSAEGTLVRTFPQSAVLGSRVIWDGKNNRGELVASGVYVFMITTDTSQSKVGKVAVINP